MPHGQVRRVGQYSEYSSNVRTDFVFSWLLAMPGLRCKRGSSDEHKTGETKAVGGQVSGLVSLLSRWSS